MSNELQKISIPSSRRLLVLEDGNLEIPDDVFDLSLSIYEARSKAPQGDNVAMATSMANLLTERWKANLNGRSITPGDALRIMGAVTKEVEAIKKNSEDNVK